MKTKRYTILIILLFIASTLLAQPDTIKNIWNLETCISYALENNLQIKTQNINNEISKLDYKQSKYNLLPNLSANISRNYNFGDKFNVYTSNYEQGTTTSDNFSLGSSIVLFSGFRQLNTIKQNKLQMLESQSEMQTTKDNITIEIAIAYLNILYSQEIDKVAESQYQSVLQQHSRITKLVEAEQLARSNLLNIEAQVAKEELNIVNTKNNLDLSYLTLYQLLDLHETDTFKVEIPTIKIPAQPILVYNLDEVINYALTNRPEVQSAEYKLQSSEKDILIARSASLPTVTLSGYLTTSYSSSYKTIDTNGAIEYLGNTPTMYVTETGLPIYMQNYNYPTSVVPYQEQITNNIYKYVGVSVNIPIFNKNLVNTNVQKAKLSVVSNKYELETTKDIIRETVKQAYFDAEATLKKYLSSKKYVEALTLSFNNTEQKYNLSMLNTVDYNIAKTDLIKAESELIQAKYDYIFKITVLDFYMGKPLKIL